MEYVCAVIKKKTHPALFEANKYAFIDKIFLSSQLQYGYHDNSYVKIGSGEFGEVLYGRLDDSSLVAIKALRKDKTDTFALLQEAFMLQIASNTGFAAHYHGLAPFNALDDRFQDWAIVCDYIGSATGPAPYDFRATLKAARNIQQTVQLVLEWIFTCTKIAFAVKQFHGMGMLLNDIKADNILLRPTSSGGHDPVFVDFGLASIGEGITLALEVNDSNRAKILKEYSHIAPEVLFGGETNAASDVFSLGKALGLVADAFPVEALSNVISRCTLWNVSERPSVDELINSFHWLSRNVVLSQ
ncbi:uncharacterized protein [Watersipora subatra]|uniref:uncharacterized protein n=1 Tax=Watersipora subatra TaxID=2589382 RepID=UPI00355C783E